MDDSDLFSSPYEILHIAQQKKKKKKNIYGFLFCEIFLFYHAIVCCVYSLETPRGDSNEYTQHTIFI